MTLIPVPKPQQKLILSATTTTTLPQHAGTRTSQHYVRTRTRTYHAGLHVAHGVEVEPLGAVDETLEHAVAGPSAVEQTHSRQVALEMLRHPALSTCSDVSERRGVEGCRRSKLPALNYAGLA